MGLVVVAEASGRKLDPGRDTPQGLGPSSVIKLCVDLYS